MARHALPKVLLGFGLFTVFSALAGVLAEVTFRLIKEPSIYQYDDRLGWAPVPDISHEFRRQGPNGDAYVVRYATNAFGFRLWGNPASDRPRIFFVGDSFTQDAHMSNQSAYFAQVARMLPAEVFAVGGGGYGTLQELIMLRKYWDIIDPTHVVVQFCTNDFHNNYHDIETFSIVRNQKNFRPYLVEGDIRFREAVLYRFVAQHSALFRYIDQRFQNLQYKLIGGYLNADGAKQSDALHDDILDVTRIILSMMRDLGAPTVGWYMFSCEAGTHEWIDVAEASGFQPIRGVAEAVAAAEAQGSLVRSADYAHWNDLGHEIAGKVLAEYLDTELSKARPQPSIHANRKDSAAHD